MREKKMDKFSTRGVIFNVINLSTTQQDQLVQLVQKYLGLHRSRIPRVGQPIRRYARSDRHAGPLS